MKNCNLKGINMGATFYWLRIKNRIIRLFKHIFEYKNGLKVFIKLINERNENETIFVLLKGIGDTVYGLCWIEAYREEHPKEIITVIGNKKLENIIHKFSVDKCVFYSPNGKEYEKYKAFLNSKNLSLKAMKEKVFNTDPYFLYAISNSNDKRNAVELLKKYVYKVNSDEISFISSYKSEITSIYNFNEIKSKIILLNPYSNSIAITTSEVYEEIILGIRNAGYIPYVNLSPGQAGIKGGIDLQCSLEELYEIAQNVAGIISVRSGILDLLAGTKVPMLVLYENCTKKFREIYSMHGWKRDAITEELIIDSNSDMLVKAVKNWISGL